MSAVRPVSGVSDGRFSNKDAKLLKTLKFPKEYDLKVDFNKVNWEVMKGWIAKRVTELLGLEDEVVIGYVFEQLENKQVLGDIDEMHMLQELNPKQLQINLTGFLEKNTSLFVKELWVHLHSANSSQSHIPQQILDQKAEELRKRKEISDQINESLAKEREKRKAEEREAARAEAAERERRRLEREERERRERAAARERERAEQDARRKRQEEAREKERALRRDRERERDRDRDRHRDHDRRHRDAPRGESPGLTRARYARSRSRERAARAAEERPRQQQSSHAEDAPPVKVEKAELDLDDGPASDPKVNGAEELPAGEADVKHKDKKHKKEKKDKKEKKEKREKKEKKRKREKDQADSGGDEVEADKKALEEELREQALQSRIKPEES